MHVIHALMHIYTSISLEEGNCCTSNLPHASLNCLTSRIILLQVAHWLIITSTTPMIPTSLFILKHNNNQRDNLLSLVQNAIMGEGKVKSTYVLQEFC